MNRCGLAVCLSLLLFGMAVASAPAQTKAQVKIASVRAGLSPGPLSGNEDIGRRAPMFKAGHWTPVLVTLEGAGKFDGADLIVQTMDCDDLLNDYAIRLPHLEFTADAPSLTILTYARPGKIDSSITVSLKSGSKDLCPAAESNPYALEPTRFLSVTLGARLSGIRLPRANDKDERCEIAAIDRVFELPEKWIGYDSADVVILTTGDEKFTDALLSDDLRRTALIDWVRRGGKLVISIGKNHGLLANREVLRAFLPVDLAGTLTPKSLRIDYKRVNEDLTDPQGKNLIDLTKLEHKPGRGGRTLGSYRSAGTTGALVTQAPYGLGRLTIVAFDLDQPPFTRWKEQGTFWEDLLRDSGPQVPTSIPRDPGMAFAGERPEEMDMLGRLQTDLETFDGVPVISFGWVALFIVIYILVVGPLDYLFLKKVVKRLELTWITFPIVVLAVSAGAYFTAYALKGDDQKVNKLDLIDIDLPTETIHGHSWFSLFSPRIQNFTVGLQPREAWGVKQDGGMSTLVSWFGRARSGRQSLFRRSYDYDTNLGGLLRVPIQVWSTKGFQVNWEARLDMRRPPMRSELLNAPESKLGGSVVSNLPVPLVDAVIIHKGNLYPLGTLLPGEVNRKQVTVPDPTGLEQWLKAGYVSRQTLHAANNPGQAYVDPEPAQKFMRQLMFHERFARTEMTPAVRNAAVRELDQSWRLSPEDPGDVAILVGKVEVENGPADTVAQKPATAALLWVGALPGSGVEHPKLDGKMRQETYVRIFLPVKARR